jgi:hypothetical protein
MTVWQEARSGYHLDREFRAVTDCRYGHVGIHLITSAFKDQWTGRRRVHRVCVNETCKWPNWSEWAFTAGGPA